MDIRIRRVLEQLSLDAETDWVWVSTVAEHVLAADSDPTTARSMVDSTLARMVTSGDFVPGDCHPVIRGERGFDAELPPRDEFFHRWDGDRATWIMRILGELDAWALTDLRPFDIATFVPSSSDHAGS